MFTTIKHFSTLLILLGFACICFAQVNISPGSTVTENFTIGTSATATLPTGWKVDKNTTARSVGSYTAAIATTNVSVANNMSTTAGNGIYNYGAGTDNTGTDRAVGGLSSGSASKSVNVYVKLHNNGTATINELSISYNVEKYRKGTNSAGFSIQMYYSTDGTSWTSAGTDFLSSFAADADNNGYATTPGDTKPVSNKTLSQSIATGADFYLAWNYSVTSGTTTSSAQALGVDDISIVAAGAPSSNHPPQVTNVTTPDNLPLEDQAFTVNANVTDIDNDLDTIEASYKVNGNSAVNAAMTLSSGSTYTYNIPASAYANGDIVEYWVSAMDDSLNVVESTHYTFFAGITPIATARTMDANNAPLYLNKLVRVQGTAICSDGTFSAVTQNDSYIQDDNAGIGIYKIPSTTTIIINHNYTVVGTIAFYNGKIQLTPSIVTDNGAVSAPTPAVVTVSELIAYPEQYESRLIGLQFVKRTSGTWPTASGAATLYLKNTFSETDSVALYIDVDTNIDGTTEPIWPLDIQGVFMQYDNSSPYTSGYQFCPRNTGDFLISGTLPVTLTSFTAEYLNGSNSLTWVTASESGVLGYHIYRSQSNDFATAHCITSNLIPARNTAITQTYNFRDTQVTANQVYYYWLEDLENTNTTNFYGPISTSTDPGNVSEIAKTVLREAYPNPFNPTTTISYDIRSEGPVSLKIFNAKGQLIRTCFEGRRVAGSYSFVWNGISDNNTQVKSGIYFIQLKTREAIHNRKILLLK